MMQRRGRWMPLAVALLVAALSGSRLGRHAAADRVDHSRGHGNDLRDGGRAKVVGVSSFDAFPPGVALPRVGALLDPDVERMLSLRPDLCGALRHAGRAEAAIGPREHSVLLVRAPRARGYHVDRACRGHTHRIGGARRAAGGRHRTRHRAVRTSVAKRAGRGRCWCSNARARRFATSTRPAGTDSFDMVEAAGGDDVFADIKQQSVQATTELILAAPGRHRRAAVRRQPQGRRHPREMQAWNALADTR